jgi:hypothetical protein
MSALATLPTLATVDEIIAMLDGITDRASLLAFLAPLRCPDSISDDDRARLTEGLMRAAARCWKGRFPV